MEQLIITSKNCAKNCADKDRKKSIFAKVLFISIFLLTSFSVFSQTEELYKLQSTLNYIQSFYVDTVNQSQLVDEAIIAMLKQLDPHSVYIPAEDVEAVNQPLLGSFNGVGIQYNVLNDTILVVKTIKGGPSEAVGLRAGDRVIYIEGELVAGVGITTEKIKALLMGQTGTDVELSVVRNESKELMDYVVTRNKVPIYSLDAAYMIDNEIGYIKINKFSLTTVDEFRVAIGRLKKQGLQNLILDLRGNGGGYLHIATQLADEFLESGKLIVYTEGVRSPRNETYASGRGEFEQGKLVVLIDEGSASASEIVTGAIQDWDRGIVIGRRSFGKGLVQQPYTLNDGSLIRLTIARYYTPSGRLIQKPYDEGYENYNLDLANRATNGEMQNSDSIHFNDSLVFFTKLNHRLVFGGGGIMPDIFVPQDSIFNSEILLQLIEKEIISSFSLQYADANRNMFDQKFKYANNFISQFSVNEEIIQSFFQFTKNKWQCIRMEIRIS